MCNFITIFKIHFNAKIVEMHMLDAQNIVHIDFLVYWIFKLKTDWQQEKSLNFWLFLIILLAMMHACNRWRRSISYLWQFTDLRFTVQRFDITRLSELADICSLQNSQEGAEVCPSWLSCCWLLSVTMCPIIPISASDSPGCQPEGRRRMDRQTGSRMCHRGWGSPPSTSP